MHISPANKTPRSPMAGFSLFELLTVLVVMAVIFTAVFTLLRSSVQASATTYETTDAQQALRIAQTALSRDLYSVGDGLIGVSDVRVPLGFTRNYLSRRPDAELDPDGDGFVRLPLILSENNLPAGTALLGAPSALARPGTDRLTMLQADASFTPLSLAANAVSASGEAVAMAPADISKFTVGEIYYFTNGTAAAFATVTGISAGTVNFSAGDVYGLNQANSSQGFISFVTAHGTVPVTLRRMRIIHYFVTDTGLLVRRVFGVVGRGLTDSVIGEHITAFNLRYLLDLTNADGTLQQPVNELLTDQQQNAVRQVESSVTAETARPLQNSGQRAAFTATQQISVRNLKFRDAQQPVSGVIE